MQYLISSLLLIMTFSSTVYAQDCNTVTLDDESKVNPNYQLVAQMDKLKGSSFCLGLISEIGDKKTKYKVSDIYVLKDDSEVITQRIKVVDADYISANPHEMLKVVDYNFDSYPDFFVYYSDGGISPNYINYFYKFNVKTKTFDFDDFVSALSQPTINSKDHYVESNSRDGCCNYELDRYHYVNNQPVLFHTKEQSITGDGKYIEISIGDLKNGKMKYITKKEKAPTE